MKSFAFSIFICAGLIVIQPMAFGQDKLSISFGVVPEFTRSRSSAIVPEYNPGTPGYQNLETSSYEFSYSAGLMARYSFSKKWSVVTGLWATHPFSGRYGLRYPNYMAVTRLKFNDPFQVGFKLPLTVNFRTSVNRISPYLSAGTTFDFRPRLYSDITGDGNKELVKIGKAVTLTPIIGAGLIADIKEHLSLIVQPTFQYRMLSQKGYDYRWAYSTGLQVQLMFRF